MSVYSRMPTPWLGPIQPVRAKALATSRSQVPTKAAEKHTSFTDFVEELLFRLGTKVG